MTKKSDVQNPWKYEDDLVHENSIIEWWAFIFFFRSLENNKKWDSKTGFVQWNEKTDIGSMFNFSMFNESEGKSYGIYSKNYEKQLDSKKGMLNVRYEDCWLKGSYPNYEFYVNDKKDNIKLNVKYKAVSLPRWVAQDVTKGWLPMGSGFYRYGFIPINKISGTMEIKNKKYKIEGEGYLEHVWGDMWYDNPFVNVTGMKRAFSIYLTFLKWWIKHNKITIPNSIKYATENNPFGYDWSWALFENGWTLFYGNIMSYIMEGPATGTLVLSKDGKNYQEFSNITFKYNKVKESVNYDFVFPTDLEIKAKNGKEALDLRFRMTADPREYVSKFAKGKYFIGFIIAESPGIVEGFYSDGEKKVKLKGIAKIEPQRQVTIFGHNTLKIDFLKPPNGFGISIDLDTHYLNKRLLFNLQLAPRPKIKFKVNKAKDHKNNIEIMRKQRSMI